ncbi:MAG TPA: hypothetical protein DEA55_05125 [Rhodospirillaceae bacterium]|nr:hypothetical protein [Rhodospirillaceae bacterium]
MRSLFLHVLTVFIGVVAIHSAAQAQTSIGIVDIQKVISESSAGKSIQAQVEEQKKAFQAELSKIEQELKDAQKSLVEQKDKLSKEEFATQRQDFDQKRAETSTLVQKRKAGLDRAFTEALQTLEKEIMAIIKGISTERKFDLVLSRNNVFVGNDSLDISNEVTERLNKALQEVKVEVKEVK